MSDSTERAFGLLGVIAFTRAEQHAGSDRRQLDIPVLDLLSKYACREQGRGFQIEQ